VRDDQGIDNRFKNECFLVQEYIDGGTLTQRVSIFGIFLPMQALSCSGTRLCLFYWLLRALSLIQKRLFPGARVHLQAHSDAAAPTYLWFLDLLDIPCGSSLPDTHSRRRSVHVFMRPSGSKDGLRPLFILTSLHLVSNHDQDTPHKVLHRLLYIASPVVQERPYAM
jgi:hypothetical protein